MNTSNNALVWIRSKEEKRAEHIPISSRAIRKFKEKKLKGILVYSKHGRPASIDRNHPGIDV